MKRQIIKINEELCDGCGDCVVGCSEGAIRIIDGKAKLVRDDFCDGFGDCVEVCHCGALVIENRDAPEFDEIAVKENLLRTKGKEAVWRLEDAHARHHNGGKKCLGLANFAIEREKERQEEDQNNRNLKSELGQWPVQLHLINPVSPFLKDRELVLLSTCSPVATPEVHSQFMKDRAVALACPKLDKTEPYVEKLASIFSEGQISKLIIVRMEVPCCRGLSTMSQAARTLAKLENLPIEEYILSIGGDLKQTNTI